jgi:histidyl-tRNA synthetase
VIGDSEVQSKQVQVKDLAAHSQELVGRADVVATVAKLLASAPKVSEAAR